MDFREITINKNPHVPSPPSRVVVVVHTRLGTRVDVYDPRDTMFIHDVFARYPGYNVYYVFKDLFVTIEPGNNNPLVVEAHYGRELWKIRLVTPLYRSIIVDVVKKCHRDPQCGAYHLTDSVVVLRYLRLLTVDYSSET